MSRLPVTALVICYNEADTIGRCLESLAWVDDLFVVDSYSTDATLEIARRYTDHIVQHEFTTPAAQKNWALPQCAHDWVLAVDADEWVSDALRATLERTLEAPPAATAFDLKRENFFFGRHIAHCGWDRDYVVRLFDRRVSRYADVRVHEKVLTDGRTERLAGALYHNTFRSMAQYFEKFDRYTTWGAQDLRARGRRATVTALCLRPPARFLKMYVLQLGFLDGGAGLVLCLLAACNVLVKYVKLWGLDQTATPQPNTRPLDHPRSAPERRPSP